MLAGCQELSWEYRAGKTKEARTGGCSMIRPRLVLGLFAGVRAVLLRMHRTRSTA
jgi:hypothetical protein